MLKSIKEAFTELLIGGVFRYPFYFETDRGEWCKNYSPPLFKYPINAFLVSFNIFYNLWMWRKYPENPVFKTEPKENRYIIEKIFGYTCSIIWLLQIVYKINSSSVIYITMPCHLTMILIAIISFSPKKLYWVYNMLLSMMFGCTLALIFPGTTSTLIGPYEVELFYIEHLIPFIVVPVYYILFFSDLKWWDPMVHQKGYCLFSIYQRAVCFPLSELTWVNINSALCGHVDDPFWLILGYTHNFFADIYINFGCYLARLFSVAPGALLKITINLFSKKNKKLD